MRQVAFAGLLLVLLFPKYVRGQQDLTLADVLKQNAVSFPLSSVSHLNDPITSYATLNTDREFLIAYYLVNPGDELHFPLFVTRFDKRSGRWQEASLTDLKAKIFEGTEPEMQADCIGSALRFEGQSNLVLPRFALDSISRLLGHLEPRPHCPSNLARVDGSVLQIRFACLQGKYDAFCAASS